MTPMVINSVVLRRLTTQDLPGIVGWFQDPDAFTVDPARRREGLRPG